MPLPGFELICSFRFLTTSGEGEKIRCKSRKSFVPHLICAPNRQRHMHRALCVICKG
jgi:hypothetical protein